MRDSITLTVHYDTPLDLSGSTVIGLSQSGQTPDVVEYVVARPAQRRVHGRDHERPRLRPRGRGRGDDPARGRAGARRRRDEDLRQHARARSRCSRATSPAAGPADRRTGSAAPRRPCSRLAARVRGGDALARAPVRLHRPDVRDRARDRVRDGAGDRAEAARDLPGRGRAADRDRSRARPGRRARPALPRLGDRLAGRDACRPCRRPPRGSTRWVRRSSRAAPPPRPSTVS